MALKQFAYSTCFSSPCLLSFSLSLSVFHFLCPPIFSLIFDSILPRAFGCLIQLIWWTAERHLPKSLCFIMRNCCQTFNSFRMLTSTADQYWFCWHKQWRKPRELKMKKDCLRFWQYSQRRRVKEKRKKKLLHEHVINGCWQVQRPSKIIKNKIQLHKSNICWKVYFFLLGSGRFKRMPILLQSERWESLSWRILQKSIIQDMTTNKMRLFLGSLSVLFPSVNPRANWWHCSNFTCHRYS